MKLKLVVASMSILGLISCPVFAANHAKHKRHHKLVKHEVRQEVVAQPDYKDMGSMTTNVEAVCSVSPSSILLAETTQNSGRSIPNPCTSADWFKRIQMSGGMNFDLGKWGNRNASYQGENYQRFSLNDIYVNFGADINEWAKAFSSINFSNPTITPNNSTISRAEYSAAYSNNVRGTAVHSFQLEQAYVTINNADMSPLMLQVGKGFQDFGRYDIHPITRSMTQVMSETLATSAKLGFSSPMGVHGGVFVFDELTPRVGQTQRNTNYGLAIGFDQTMNDQLGYDLGASYLNNISAVNDIAFSVNTFTANGGYTHRVGGVALYGDVMSGPFSINARFVEATQRFALADLPRFGYKAVGSTTKTSTTGAKPWSMGIQAGYAFTDMFNMGFGKKQNLYIGYQMSRQTAGLQLPKNRYEVGYNMDVWKGTNLGVQWDHDVARNAANGGTGRNTNLVSLRAAVQFG